MAYSDLKDAYNDVKKDKILSIIIRLFFGLILFASIVAIIIFIHHSIKDKPAKLFFGLIEINTVKTDTVIKLVEKKVDTITTIKENSNYSFSPNNF